MNCCKTKIWLLLVAFLCTIRLYAQVPSTCFEIESILVDACGSPEGQNEMVMFQVGPNALNTSALSVTYPNANTPYVNICQSAATAAFVAAVNATITGCGHVLEPVGGVLPAGASVILVSSAAANASFNTFTNLNDTLYVIFDCGTYSSGHFANYAAGGGTRTLTMSFNPPGGGCTETVTYDRDLLSSANGATALFSWAGVPTYTNPGCQAPFIPLAPDAGLPRTLCVGTSSLTLSGSVSPAGRPFAWSGGTGSFSSTTTLTPTYTLGAGDVGTFFLYLNESSTCATQRDSIAITIAPLPNFSLPQDTAFCGNFGLTLSASTAGSSYLWSTGQTSANITASTPGTYTLTLTDANGCSNTDAITIGTTTLSQVGLPNDTSICAGSNLNISPTVPGNSYTWSTGATSSSISVSTPGTYTLEMLSNGGTCLGRDTFTLGNIALPTVALGNDTTVCPGQSVTFDANPGGINPGAIFAWTNSSSTSSITVGTPGIYGVLVTNPQGCTALDNIQLNNFPAPALNLGNDTSICQGSTLPLLAAPGGSAYLWSTGASTPTINASTAGSYAVTVSYGLNCSITDAINVQLVAQPVLALGQDTALCPGGSLTLDAGNGGGSYTWSTGATSAQITVTSTGNYSVTLNFGGSCVASDTILVQNASLPSHPFASDTSVCPGQSIQLDANPGGLNPGATFAWSTGSNSATINATAPGPYTVTITNPQACTTTDSITVQPGTLPTVNLAASVSICPGSSTLLDPGLGSSAYLWSTGASTPTLNVTSPGLYYVLGSNDCGTDSAAIQVALAPTPSAYAGADDTLCAGAALPLTGAIAVGTTVQWSAASGSFFPSDSLQATYTADTAASGPVALVLTVQDSCGMASDTLFIEVLPALQVTVTHPDTVCNLSPVQLGYTSNGSNHLWIGNGTFSDSSGSPTTFSPSAGQQGELMVSLIAQGQCGTDTLSASYFVEADVLAAFVWTPMTVYPGTWVEFDCASLPTSGLMHWEFGDGFSSAETAPAHQYYAAGTYPVELIAYGAGGCNDTLSLPLVVIQPDTLIPNVFSPNGDGINDTFDIFGERLPPAVRSFNLGIFDRWGRQVFVSTDPNVKWEGNTEGRALPDGVYYYVLQMEPLTGGTLNYAGPVTLVR